ncbi:MAG: chorismate pyruvate-lyase family protein [Methanobacteriaceae archaeon]|jgi:chorismate-pyruvate lyase|nr:chorismate pyruvate-lyase family protein [Candidatus Methanorudis spinitermitis]
MNGKKNDTNILNEIAKLEKNHGNLSNTQKILLATDGSVTTILDVLNGKISIKTLTQQFEKADEKIAKLLNIKVNDDVNYRVVLMHKDDKPLIHAISYIPLERLGDDFKKDLIMADMPIGRILRKYNIESRREVKNVAIEKTNNDLKKLFNSDADLLTRDYNIIRNGKVLIWIKESFPLDYFSKQ